MRLRRYSRNGGLYSCVGRHAYLRRHTQNRFLPVRSHFDTKRPVNFFHIATFQSATFGRPVFAFVLCVLRQKSLKNRKCFSPALAHLQHPVQPLLHRQCINSWHDFDASGGIVQIGFHPLGSFAQPQSDGSGIP